MDSFLIDLAVSTLISLLRRLAASKGSRDGEMSRVTMRKVFLKIQVLIWGVYGDDAGFRQVVGAPLEHDPELVAEAGPIVYPGV